MDDPGELTTPRRRVVSMTAAPSPHSDRGHDRTGWSRVRNMMPILGHLFEDGAQADGMDAEAAVVHPFEYETIVYALITANCVCALAMAVVYANALLILPYFTPLLWGFLFSVALKTYKWKLVSFLRRCLAEKPTNEPPPRERKTSFTLAPSDLIGAWKSDVSSLLGNIGDTIKKSVTPLPKKPKQGPKGNRPPHLRVPDHQSGSEPVPDGGGSELYFRLLLWGCGGYLAFTWVAWLGFYNLGMLLVVGVVVVAGLIAVVVLYQLLAIITHLDPVKVFMKTADEALRKIPSKSIEFCYEASSNTYDLMIGGARAFVEPNIHEIAASIIIVVLLLLANLFLGFFAVKVALETKQVLDSAVLYANQAVDNTAINRTDISSILAMGVASGKTWVEERWGSNVSLLLDRIYTMVTRNTTVTGSNSKPTPTTPQLRTVLPNTDRLLQIIWTDPSRVSMSQIYQVGQEVYRELLDGSNVADFWGYSSTIGSSLLTNIAVSLGTVLSTMFQTFSYALGSMLSFSIFLGVLYYLLSAQDDPVQGILTAFSINPVFRVKVSQAIYQAVRGVFVSTGKVFIFHLLFTWLTYSLFGLEFKYISCVASGCLAIVPLLSSWMVAVLGMLQLAARGAPVSGFVLWLLHYSLVWFVDPAIYAEIPSSHPYFTGLSILMGLARWDLMGALVGPLIVCVPVIMHNLFSEAVEESAAKLAATPVVTTPARPISVRTPASLHPNPLSRTTPLQPPRRSVPGPSARRTQL